MIYKANDIMPNLKYKRHCNFSSYEQIYDRCDGPVPRKTC
jgi:hypothetical protein